MVAVLVYQALTLARLARLGGDGSEPVVLTGREASEERIKREVRGKHFVHLATHGFFAPEGAASMLDAARNEADSAFASPSNRKKDLDGPLPGFLSGIVLAGANRRSADAREDGILTAEEVAWLDLSACELATLSACETGLGTPQAGEQLIGLRRSLRLAGARATLTSLWKVDDEATLDLMRVFYRQYWVEGKSKIDALREAQLDMLERNRARYDDAVPGTWGAFVLDGDWR